MNDFESPNRPLASRNDLDPQEHAAVRRALRIALVGVLGYLVGAAVLVAYAPQDRTQVAFITP